MASRKVQWVKPANGEDSVDQLSQWEDSVDQVSQWGSFSRSAQLQSVESSQPKGHLFVLDSVRSLGWVTEGDLLQ